MSKKWISSLLRARQAQEDVARERLATARNHAQSARARVRADDDRVQAMVESEYPESAQAFLAAAAARQAAAATLASARRLHALAEDQVDARSSSVTAAARQRRTAEKLVERDEAELRAREALALQNELDDVAGRRARRPDDTAVTG
jgi:flagellar export protein FliJ